MVTGFYFCGSQSTSIFVSVGLLNYLVINQFFTILITTGTTTNFLEETNILEKYG